MTRTPCPRCRDTGYAEVGATAAERICKCGRPFTVQRHETTYVDESRPVELWHPISSKAVIDGEPIDLAEAFQHGTKLHALIAPEQVAACVCGHVRHESGWRKRACSSCMCRRFVALH